MQIFMLKCRRPAVYRDAPRGRDPATERAWTTGPTWQDIFPAGEPVDLTDEGTWKAIASRLGGMPIESAINIAARVTNEMLKIRLLRQKGAGGAMLTELRKMAQDLFGESTQIEERDDAEEDDR